MLSRMPKNLLQLGLLGEPLHQPCFALPRSLLLSSELGQLLLGPMDIGLVVYHTAQLLRDPPAEPAPHHNIAPRFTKHHKIDSSY